MHFNRLLALFLGSIATASPIPCPDATRDAVLNGLMDPSACCSYGKCLRDVNIESG